MIFDTIIHFNQYISTHPFFLDIASFLNTIDTKELEIGKIELPNNAYVLVSEYSSKNPNECNIECHRKYIDIQIVLEGIENIGFCSIESCSAISEYDEKKDFQKLNGVPEFLTLKPSVFAIFFPHDAHMPQVYYNKTPSKIKKMVIKIPVSYFD